jgi:hypothetical protein
VAEDVRVGYLTTEQARIRYGVVLDENHGIDEAATAAARGGLVSARRFVQIELANQDDIDGPRRRFAVSPGLARALEVADGDLVELRSPRSVPLRGWARIESGGEETTIALGPGAMQMLRAEAGDRIELRAVHAAPAGMA